MKRLAIVAFFGLVACAPNTSDSRQQAQQEKLLDEGTSQVGMPAIKNFRERRQLKEIYELRDEQGLVTYTYLFSEVTGKANFFCTSIGYGIPYATQFTNPEKLETHYHIALPQADPNGLFSPPGADATWVTCLSPDKSRRVVYVEPKIIVSPYKLQE